MDPYANAFKLLDSSLSPNYQDSTTSIGFLGSRINAMGPQIFERKYELDTLANFLHLSGVYL